MQNETIHIDIESVDFFPSVIDYDFIKNRPRGGSCRIDFFSYGKVSNMLDGLEHKPYVFFKMEDTIFENGIILVDFSTIDSSADDIAKMIKDIKPEKVHIEQSDSFSIDKLVKKLTDIEVVLMSFK